MEVKGDLDVKENLRVADNAKFDRGLDSPYLEIIDEKAYGAAGGTFTEADWRTRDLTTLIADDFAESVTLAPLAGGGGQFTIPAGEYHIDANAPAFSVNEHQARLADVTDTAGSFGVSVIDGTSEFAADAAQWRDSAEEQMTIAASSQSRSFVTGRFTVTRSTTLELQHRCAVTQDDDGLGSASGFSPFYQTYSIVKMWQVRDDTV